MILKIFIAVSVIGLALVGIFSDVHSYKTQNPDDYISFTTIYMTASDHLFQLISRAYNYSARGQLPSAKPLGSSKFNEVKGGLIAYFIIWWSSFHGQKCLFSTGR